MEKIQEVNNVCKEVLTILAYTDNNLIEQIPDKVFKKLQEYAADSKIDFYINEEKDLKDQDISEECKDFISLLYYSYFANENEKKELAKIWDINEEKYQKELHTKYVPNILFKKVLQQENNNIKNETALIEYKESFFSKLRNFIFKMLHIEK